MLLSECCCLNSLQQPWHVEVVEGFSASQVMSSLNSNSDQMDRQNFCLHISEGKSWPTSRDLNSYLLHILCLFASLLLWQSYLCRCDMQTTVNTRMTEWFGRNVLWTPRSWTSFGKLLRRARYVVSAPLHGSLRPVENNVTYHRHTHEKGKTLRLSWERLVDELSMQQFHTKPQISMQTLLLWAQTHSA